MRVNTENMEVNGHVQWEVRDSEGLIDWKGQGEVEGFGENTIQTAMKNMMAYAIGTTTFTAINAIDFKVNTAWGNQQLTSIDGGGDNTVNWIRFRADYTAGTSETVSLTQLGVASGVSLGTIYSEYDISDVALNSGDTLIVKWTITIS